MASLVRVLVFLLAVASGLPSFAVDVEPSSIKFLDTQYIYRWSKDTQHEFTPSGQEDLVHFTDMLTINYFGPKDGEGLSAIANTALETYKKNKGKVLKTDSVARTTEKPAEHLIVVLFPRPDFIEAAFTRFAIVKGVGLSATYSHREHGKEVGDKMSEWLKKNGQIVEKSLMKLSPIPLADELKK